MNQAQMNRTALVYHPDYLLHYAGPGHLEVATRLSETMSLFEGWGLLEKLELIKPEAASREDILRVHTDRHYTEIKNASNRGGVQLDPDTCANKNTFEVALLAAGGVIEASNSLLEGRADNSIALVRPPGHHASQDRAMGFCYFNNVAIAVRHIQEVHGIKKICIVDWDCHASNGTMDIFSGDKDVLNISLHQDPSSFYPARGFAKEMGNSEGLGYQVNVPFQGGAGNSDYQYAFEEFLVPLIDGFDPDFIFISAGFDSHLLDSISQLRLTDVGYARMAYLLNQLADEKCGGNISLELEGGYNTEALALSLREIAQVFLGESEPKHIKDSCSKETVELITQLKDQFSAYHKL
ncbi:MAG: histone deacetylase [Candidatus Altiarchaeota archaeon]